MSDNDPDQVQDQGHRTANYVRDSSGDRVPPRHGRPWGAEDFAGIMAACRDDCDLQAIAQRIGRSTNGVRNHLRRLLPLEERQILPELLLPRLRQLNKDGDYDWLAAMAQQHKPQWEIELEAHDAARADAVANARAVGVGALPDNHLAALAVAVVRSAVALPPALGQELSVEIAERGLRWEILDQVWNHVSASASSLLNPDRPHRDIEELVDPWDGTWTQADAFDRGS